MQQRWDVALKVLNGPLAAMGEQVFRGPVVRIGAEPGPGGFRLSGYRGLDARHAVITAYEGGTATIAPVGTNQVRMAPHSHVNWKEIDPMSGPEYLSEGCAVHLGPVGRGATLEYVESRRLGVWQSGGLASEASALGGAAGGSPMAGGQIIGGPGGAPPASFDARKVSSISASSVPVWFLGGLFLMAFGTTALILAVVFIRAITIEQLGPKEEGEPFYEFTTIKAEDINPKLREGLNQPFSDFVMAPNIEASGKGRLSDPELWDEKFYEKVAASVQMHLKSWSMFRRLDVVRDDWSSVLEVLEEEGLPDVFAAIPYQESLYDGTKSSHACAAGYWQFMPEVAYRVSRQTGMAFVVKDCQFSDAPDVLWTPKTEAPPPGVMKNAEYILRDPVCTSPKPEARCCRIKKCNIDHRGNLGKSTQAAAFSLGEAWRDDTLRASGGIVQLTITSHNAGYDDSRFGPAKKSNVLPAYKRWAKGKERDELHTWYGENITTETPFVHDRNGSVIAPETQHYAYSIVAQHLIAVCYYGQNYADEYEQFADYRQYTRSGGYCQELNIPTADDVKKKKATTKRGSP